MKDPAAHLGGPGGQPHPLLAHLEEVARLAGRFAAEAAPADPDLDWAARCAGWLHDLGKYREEFQLYLRGAWKEPEKQKRHAVYGAAAIVERSPSAAFAILGHHLHWASGSVTMR